MSKFIPNKEDSRTTLIFCFHLKKTSAESYRLLREAYGEHAPSQDTCERFFRRFKSGDFDVGDKERGKPPKKYQDVELQALLDADDSQTQKQLAQQLGVTQQAVSYRLRERALSEDEEDEEPSFKTPSKKRKINPKTKKVPVNRSTYKRRNTSTDEPDNVSHSTRSTSKKRPQKPSSRKDSEESTSTAYINDEFDIFANNIVFKLRDLPPHNLLLCQEKIKAIFNEQCSLVQSGQDIESVVIKEEPVISEQFCDENIQTVIKGEAPSP